MIRKATADDTGRIVEMGRRFADETSYKDILTVDSDRISATVAVVLANPDGVVLVSGSDELLTGMIAMMAYDHPFSGERTAFEVVWWVEPEARGDGVRLLRAAEKWAKDQGAKSVQMIAPNERVGTLYKRLGYELVETSYQRSL